MYTNKIKEAKQVIENIQEMNISLINELYTFCDKTRIDFKK